jgi:hypothetical protein
MAASKYRKRKIYDRHLSNVVISRDCQSSIRNFKRFFQPQPVPHREHSAFQLHIILSHMFDKMHFINTFGQVFTVLRKVEKLHTRLPEDGVDMRRNA